MKNDDKQVPYELSVLDFPVNPYDAANCERYLKLFIKAIDTNVSLRKLRDSNRAYYDVVRRKRKQIKAEALIAVKSLLEVHKWTQTEIRDRCNLSIGRMARFRNKLTVDLTIDLNVAIN